VEHRRGRPYKLTARAWLEGDSRADEHIRWTRDFYGAVEQHAGGRVYVNFLGDEGEERVRAAYDEEKYERLRALKRRYDPTNVFRLNQNIRP
jgi:FAD/FMN-containing dehydrogenase